MRARKLAGVRQRLALTTSVEVDGDEERLTFTAPTREALPDILCYLVTSGAQVYQFTPQRLSLEELFMNIMGEDRGL